MKLNGLRSLVAPGQIVGRLVKADPITVTRDGQERALVRIEVWGIDGEQHVDFIPTASRSRKRQAWAATLERLGISNEGTELATQIRSWSYQTGGGGEYVFTLLTPGEEVELEVDTDDLSLISRIIELTGGTIQADRPFIVSQAFASDLASGLEERLSHFRGDITRWIRALVVMGLIEAEQTDQDIAITGFVHIET